MHIPIYVSTSATLKNIRCLKASRDIKKGEIIESCPVILVPMAEYDHLESSILRNYEFDWNEEFEAVVLGYGSLFNHSFDANVTFEPDEEKKVMNYIADRDIRKDEELFINYAGNHQPHTPLDDEYLDCKY